MFTGVTKNAREEGRGSVDHKEVITDEDMKKINDYFTAKMRGPVNGKYLQQLMLFVIIYQMGRRGRENLWKWLNKLLK